MSSLGGMNVFGLYAAGYVCARVCTVGFHCVYVANYPSMRAPARKITRVAIDIKASCSRWHEYFSCKTDNSLGNVTERTSYSLLSMSRAGKTHLPFTIFYTTCLGSFPWKSQSFSKALLGWRPKQDEPQCDQLPVTPQVRDPWRINKIIFYQRTWTFRRVSWNEHSSG